ncbi:hypothetical protein CQ046_22410 [Chryseobacterium sp. MYb7]|uniref:hypothetical protein n=1 Tax=Chryseobacterium sp. MYb7 TaxID=1827290 RepID=UPI000CFE6F4D|nr:hypothetical protein [Chryseobacterium sp. MYb7]PRA94542.1 hypothetical protein CQ046_22410 [Chryseobacterium sp. MYb7]
MKEKEYLKELEKLEKDLFINEVFSYESTFIKGLERSMSNIFKGFGKSLEFQNPISEEGILFLSENIQNGVVEYFSLSESLIKIFEPFKYAIHEEDQTIFFQSTCMLEIFSNYLQSENFEIDFDGEDPIFDFMYHLYYADDEGNKEKVLDILYNFHLKLSGFIVYRDHLKLFRFFNREFLIEPNDNHIPIRIALLDSLNLINDLNNNVPNKENIYRIIHAIVGGNEDNVKKYCLSLIGKNSLSQKQITRKHKEFARKYINEKKL